MLQLNHMQSDNHQQNQVRRILKAVAHENLKLGDIEAP